MTGGIFLYILEINFLLSSNSLNCSELLFIIIHDPVKKKMLVLHQFKDQKMISKSPK